MDASLTGFIGIEACPAPASTIGTGIRATLGTDSSTPESAGSKTGSFSILTLVGEGAGSTVLTDEASASGKSGICHLAGYKKG